MLSLTTNIDRSTAASYATASDFCRVFAEDMNKLYLLSLLLTADWAKAELCFTSALEDCSKSSRVFREWTRSWARRSVIQNAIRIAGPELQRERGRAESRVQMTPETEPLAAVTRLNQFERFVYVMSVLEKVSDQDCAVLLRCRRQRVVEARLRALQHLAGKTENKFASGKFGFGQLLAESA